MADRGCGVVGSERGRTGSGPAGAALSPSAPERDESGCGNRLLYARISEYVEGDICRTACVKGGQRICVVQQSGPGARAAAADRHLALRVARDRRTPEP